MSRRVATPPPLAPDLANARILWTAGGIARRLGCSADFVRTVLMATPGCPIHRLGGKIYAVEDALIAWMRDPTASKPVPTD